MADTSDLSQNAAHKPKLLDQMRNEIRLRHMARSTDAIYLNWARRFILFHHKRHPREMGADEVGAFLTHVAVDLDVSSPTQKQRKCRYQLSVATVGVTDSCKDSRWALAWPKIS